MYHATLVFQGIYGRSDGKGENGDGNEGSDIPVGRERVNITWPLECRCLDSGQTWFCVRKRSVGDGGKVCWCV